MPERTSLLPRTPPGAGIALAVFTAALLATALGARGWSVVGLAGVAGLVAAVACAPAWRATRDRMGRVGDAAARLGQRIRGGGDPIAMEALAEELGSLRSELEDHITVLSRERRDLRAIVEAVDSPVMATDADGVIRLCNAAGDRLFGGASHPKGRLIEQVFTQPEILVIHGKALRGERSTRQLRVAADDGQVRVFEVTAVPARLSTEDDDLARRSDDTDATGVVLTLLDVTELAAAMQLKTDFVANASHELRTPLASVRAAAETLGSLGPDDAEMRDRVLGMLERNAVRLEEMMRDLLDLARLESPEAEFDSREVDLRELAGQLATMYERTCQERALELRFELQDEPIGLRTDPTLLTLILKNLVENALKFAHPDTAVRVRMQRSAARQTPTLAGGHEQGVFRLEVIDRGKGIPLKAQQRIFERFFQVDPARSGHPHERGTGLGLAIVKHAVRALDGRIWVESVYGEGTTMVVELPMVGRPPAAEARLDEPPATEQG